jgi:hypothetical protein
MVAVDGGVQQWSFFVGLDVGRRTVRASPTHGDVNATLRLLIT